MMEIMVGRRACFVSERSSNQNRNQMLLRWPGCKWKQYILAGLSRGMSTQSIRCSQAGGGAYVLLVGDCHPSLSPSIAV